jgi:hypothetical protein
MSLGLGVLENSKESAALSNSVDLQRKPTVGSDASSTTPEYVQTATGKAVDAAALNDKQISALLDNGSITAKRTAESGQGVQSDSESTQMLTQKSLEKAAGREVTQVSASDLSGSENGALIAQVSRRGDPSASAVVGFYSELRDRGESSYMEVPGLHPNKSYIDVYTGRWIDTDAEGNITKTGQDTRGSLSYAINQAEHGGGAASYSHLNWRILRILSARTGQQYSGQY